ncbi:MAG: hypothetical protein JWQ34_2808 [Mucilaginibacter sp.]|uniref:hypothetical protein n=1 Tax=Mucilaginibacter sp. TaxID=1882438 RepID=UPI0026139A4C|nr:hypothetical protein [Mucilaginibacter sp.]MDB5004583.1 hypothetical protein [Mucilaginibacter sp.]
MSLDIADEFFLAFISALQRHEVRYMLIGGMAVNFHGVIRNTQDMDIWLAPTNNNRDRFYYVLLDLGYTEEEISDYKTEDFTTFFKCSIGEQPHTIDCLTFVHHNIDFDQAEKCMITHDIGESIILNVVDYDFLRQMKILTHRPQDWADVARLDELNKKK